MKASEKKRAAPPPPNNVSKILPGGGVLAVSPEDRTRHEVLLRNARNNVARVAADLRASVIGPIVGDADAVITSLDHLIDAVVGVAP
jgi:hypothetical protein